MVTGKLDTQGAQGLNHVFFVPDPPAREAMQGKKTLGVSASASALKASRRESGIVPNDER